LERLNLRLEAVEQDLLAMSKRYSEAS
jgi:trimeric autotransporter adhesin